MHSNIRQFFPLDEVQNAKRIFGSKTMSLSEAYIVLYLFFDDFDNADYLLKHQEDKPRYTKLEKYCGKSRN
jgi:hypothetical protein